MNTGVRVHTDRASFDRWARALSGVALPEELRPPATEPPVTTKVPPVVAASLALHDCAEVAITLRLTGTDGAAFGCFGLVDDLAASLFCAGDEVQIGLFQLSELVEQVVRLIPPVPPPEAAELRITMLGADAAVAGWQLTLTGDNGRWRRMPSRQELSDVAGELTADLQFALAECLAGDERG